MSSWAYLGGSRFNLPPNGVVIDLRSIEAPDGVLRVPWIFKRDEGEPRGITCHPDVHNTAESAESSLYFTAVGPVA